MRGLDLTPPGRHSEMLVAASECAPAKRLQRPQKKAPMHTWALTPLPSEEASETQETQ